MSETPQDPLSYFQRLFEEARTAGDPQPESMALGTSTLAGRPSVRMVLFKEISRGGFVFYTNYNSRKGEDLSKNPYAALTFYWPLTSKQIRIEGPTELVERSESESYFRTRPRGSQLGAWASNQSQVIPNRETLESRVADLEKLYQAKEIPCPPHWGGIRVIPERIEFWFGRENRLHDRILYERTFSGWRSSRLAP